MFYREAGQFSTTYGQDQGIWAIKQDKWATFAVIAFMFVVIPLFGSEYILNVALQFLVGCMAALALNILTGYCGQISLGTAGFMGVGAFAAYKFSTGLRVRADEGGVVTAATEMVQLIPPVDNIIFAVLLAGAVTALVGILFGLPSLRIKGFYLAVATLAAQFFLQWAFSRIQWLYDYASSSTIQAPRLDLFGMKVSGPGYADKLDQYFVGLGLVVVFGFIAKNLMRGRIGRSFMAIRDMDIAAELIGIRPLRTKLLAFAISSFFAGVAGAMTIFLYLEALEGAEAFFILDSFLYLFMVIIGGLGSIMGSYLGAAFITLMPIFLVNFLPWLGALFGAEIGSATVEHFQFMIFGALIIFFLIVEPLGLARLWQILKEKLRQWPFPY
jgi:branched-chain amino acid transport system permease protein